MRFSKRQAVKIHDVALYQLTRRKFQLTHRTTMQTSLLFTLLCFGANAKPSVNVLFYAVTCIVHSFEIDAAKCLQAAWLLVTRSIHVLINEAFLMRNSIALFRLSA